MVGVGLHPPTVLGLDQRVVIKALSQEGRKEMFYLTTHSTHFIYGYMASDIWLERKPAAAT